MHSTLINHSQSTEVFFEIAKDIYPQPEPDKVLQRIINAASTSINAEGGSVYVMNSEESLLTFAVSSFQSLENFTSLDNQITVHDAKKPRFSADREYHQTPSIPIGKGLIGSVAKNGNSVRLHYPNKDPRYNTSIDTAFPAHTTSALIIPIYGGPRDNSSNGKGSLLGIASLYNKKSVLINDSSEPSITEHLEFSELDENVFSSFLVLAGTAIYNSMLYRTVNAKEIEAIELAKQNSELYQVAKQEESKTRSLLDLACSLFQTDDVQELYGKIIGHARKLLMADQASFFLVDSEKKEVSAKVFGEHIETSISFPLGKGITGYVAQHGLPVNLKNAYEDERFNQEVDIITGYKTTSILCLPVFDRNHNILGVVAVLNKLDPTNSQNILSFTEDDQNLLNGKIRFL